MITGHALEDYGSFRHIPSSIRVQYLTKWIGEGWERTSDLYDDELAYLEQVYMNDSGIVYCRKRAGINPADLVNIDALIQSAEDTWDMKYLLLLMTPELLDPTMEYIPMQDPFDSRLNFDFIMEISLEHPDIVTQWMHTTLDHLWLAAGMRVDRIVPDPETEASELDVSLYSSLDVIEKILLATTSSFAMLGILKHLARYNDISAICKRIYKQIYNQRRSALLLLLRPMSSEFSRGTSMVLRNFQIPHKDIKIKVNNSPKQRKSKVNPDQKINKLVDLCSSVDTLAINLEVAIENYERLSQLKPFNYNDEGPTLIALIMKGFLK